MSRAKLCGYFCKVYKNKTVYFWSEFLFIIYYDHILIQLFWSCVEHRPDSITSCSIGRHTTGSTHNQDSVQFGSWIGNTANPFEIPFTRWNVRPSALCSHPLVSYGALVSERQLKQNKLSRGKTICPPPIALDLRPCADGSAVRTALVAWPRRCASSWPRHCAPRPGGTDRQTDGPTDRGIA